MINIWMDRLQHNVQKDGWMDRNGWKMVHEGINLWLDRFQYY